MRKVQETKLSEVFSLYLASAAARGVKVKTLKTYEQHFNAISKRLDVDSNISKITSKELDKMILKMREEGLSDSSINSYTRTLKVFFSWCNEQGYTKTNLKIYKPWTNIEDDKLNDEFASKMKIADIAKEHGRTYTAIESRLDHLGLKKKPFWLFRRKQKP